MERTRSITFTAIAIAATAIVLTGCTAPTGAPADLGPAVKSEQAIDPGPVELTAEEAADRYLSIVCPNNISSDAIYAAYGAGEEEYLNGGAPDVSAVVAAATSVVTNHRLAIAQLDDTYFVWPELVAAQIPHIRSAYMTNLGVAAGVMTSATFEEAYSTPAAPETPEEQAAGQEIRYQLALSADTAGSCVGHEDGLEILAAEKAERDKALAEQE